MTEKEPFNPNIKIMVRGKNGEITYQSDADINTCNGCEFLRLEPDPDPYDWFDSDDEKAICYLTEKTIARALNSWEISKIPIPKHCPLGKPPQNNKKITSATD